MNEIIFILLLLFNFVIGAKRSGYCSSSQFNPFKKNIPNNYFQKKNLDYDRTTLILKIQIPEAVPLLPLHERDVINPEYITIYKDNNRLYGNRKYFIIRGLYVLDAECVKHTFCEYQNFPLIQEMIRDLENNYLVEPENNRFGLSIYDSGLLYWPSFLQSNSIQNRYGNLVAPLPDELWYHNYRKHGSCFTREVIGTDRLDNVIKFFRFIMNEMSIIKPHIEYVINNYENVCQQINRPTLLTRNRLEYVIFTQFGRYPKVECISHRNIISSINFCYNASDLSLKNCPTNYKISSGTCHVPLNRENQEIRFPDVIDVPPPPTIRIIPRNNQDNN